MYNLIWIGLLGFVTEIIDFVSSSSRPTLGHYYNYDVTGTDFLNTQTIKLCLLARLNVSIEISYK